MMRRPVWVIGMLVLASAAGWSQPTVTQSVDVSHLRIGNLTTRTVTVSLPATDPVLPSALLQLQIDARLTVQGVTGPAKVTAAATLTYTDASGGHTVTSNAVSLYLSGVALPDRPDASGLLKITIEDLRPGDSEPVAVTAKRTT